MQMRVFVYFERKMIGNRERWKNLPDCISGHMDGINEPTRQEEPYCDSASGKNPPVGMLKGIVIGVGKIQSEFCPLTYHERIISTGRSSRQFRNQATKCLIPSSNSVRGS